MRKEDVDMLIDSMIEKLWCGHSRGRGGMIVGHSSLMKWKEGTGSKDSSLKEIEYCTLNQKYRVKFLKRV